MRRVLLALALGVLALLGLAPAASAKRAMVAFIPTQPAPKMPLLFDLEQRELRLRGHQPDARLLLEAPDAARHEPGHADRQQRLRAPARPPRPRLRASRRAHDRAGSTTTSARVDAPGDVLPGLFASTPRGGGPPRRLRGRDRLRADRGDRGGRPRGQHRATSRSARSARFAQRTLALWKRSDVVVARFPEDDRGLEALDRIVAARQPGDLIYVVRAPPPGRARLLPTGILGPGFRAKVLYSPTTRRDGMVAATDMAPTVLALPRGQDPEADGGARDRGALRRRRGERARADGAARRGARPARQGAPLLRARGAADDGAGCTPRAGATGCGRRLRIGALGGDVAAGRRAVHGGDRAVARRPSTCSWRSARSRWPPSPTGCSAGRVALAVPAAIVFGAHAVDLARGSPLIGASLAGPNPKGGSRFFGIGNELEHLCSSVDVLLGLGRRAHARRRSARRARMFALGCLVAAAIIGSGRLGADVGGVITLGAGAAAAVLASLGGRPSRKRVLLACLVPVAGDTGADRPRPGDVRRRPSHAHGDARQRGERPGGYRHAPLHDLAQRASSRPRSRCLSASGWPRSPWGCGAGPSCWRR